MSGQTALDDWTGPAVAALKDELARQDEQWGEQRHPPEVWCAIIAEEIGEAARSALRAGQVAGSGQIPWLPEARDRYRAELIQVAAVAVCACAASAGGPDRRGDVIAQTVAWAWEFAEGMAYAGSYSPPLRLACVSGFAGGLATWCLLPGGEPIDWRLRLVDTAAQALTAWHAAAPEGGAS